MHHGIICLLCTSAVASSVFGFHLEPSFVIGLLAIGIGVIGLPHGSLDHRVGRRLLQRKLGRRWAAPFFAAYLATAVVVAAGWMFLPLVTAILFFVVSAWHFGLEDEPIADTGRWKKHIEAVALGGLIIWVPSLFRAEEMREILASIVPTTMPLSPQQIVVVTQTISLFMLPAVAFRIAAGLNQGLRRRVAFRYLSFAITFAAVPILVSFGIYFCLWHSIRGLRSLKTESMLDLPRFVVAVSPLSIGAVLLIGLFSYGWSERRGVSSELTRSMFIGLSAMAVPHLILHGAAGTNAVRRWLDSGSTFDVARPEANLTAATAPLQRSIA